jgi:hypothetical protein
MKIISLFLLLGCDDIDSTVDDNANQTAQNKEVVTKIDQAKLIHGQLLDGRRNIAKEKLLKGEIEDPTQNGLHIFYYCSQSKEPELCFGDFKDAKGNANIPLYQAILSLRNKRWSKAKIYADSIEDEQLRNGIGALSLIENALQDGSTKVSIDSSQQYHESILKAFQNADPTEDLAALNDAPWYYQLIGAKIALSKSKNELANTILDRIFVDDKNPLAQIEALRLRSQISKVGLALDNLQKAVSVFDSNADIDSLVFISENIALQSRGLGETHQIQEWFEQNYNAKAFEKEKTFSSKLLLQAALSDLIGYHKQGYNSFAKLRELSGKRDNSLLFSHFTFTMVYHALNTGNQKQMKQLSEENEGELKTLLSVLSQILSSEKVAGADSAIVFLPARKFLPLGIDLCKINSDIGKRLLPKLIKTAQDYALPAFEIEASLLLESIHRIEGSSEGIGILKALGSKYTGQALSAEIAVRTYLLTQDSKLLSDPSNDYLRFWLAMLDPMNTPQFPTMKIPKEEENKNSKKSDKNEKKDVEKKDVEKKDVEKKDVEKKDDAAKAETPKVDAVEKQDKKVSSEIQYEDGVPLIFENLRQVYLLKFALKAKRVPSGPLNQFWQRSVFHRQGILSVGTVLDGSQGMSLDTYVAEYINNIDPLTVSSLFIVQEADRRRKHIQHEAAVSRNFLLGMKDINRLSLMEATHRVSIAMNAHYLGNAFPHRDFQYLQSVEESLYKKIKNAEEKSVWEKLTTNGSVDVTSLRDQFGKNAILSYTFHKGRVLGLSLSPTKAAIRDLGSQKSILGLVDRHMSQLAAGQSNPNIYKPRSPKHKLANTLRQILIEPFKGELYGFGRYLIIAPEKLLHFSFTTFPDQQDGMRFLGEKRTITASTGLEEILENSSQFGSYEPDMLAMSRLGKIEDQLAAGLQPSESVPIQIVSIHFRPDSRQILQNDEVTLEKFRTTAHGARYLYLSDIPTSTDGGFEFQDGILTLSEIHQSHLAAQVVFISATAPIDIQVKRARAFLSAGVRSVLINTLPIDQQNERIMLDALFESLNRDDTLAQALSNARSSYIKASSKQGGEVSFVSNPGVWGTFHLFGQP